MELTATSTQPQAQFAQAQTQETAISSDFETFLKMLTVQMQNQDPLNPVDSADYAVQLATFSSVEQQVLTNDLLQAMSMQIAGLGLGEHTSWIGMEARAVVPAEFQGNPIELSLQHHHLAEDVWISVTDVDGFEVDRRQAALNQDVFQWSGSGADGAPLPEGSYRFSVESFAAGELIESVPAAVYIPVVETRMGPTGVELVLAGGQVVGAEQVTALRQPD